MMRCTTKTGLPVEVRIVPVNDFYGRDNTIQNTYSEPLVQFRLEQNGGWAFQYLMSTLLETEPHEGLFLQYPCQWSFLDGEEMWHVVDWILSLEISEFLPV